MPTPSRVVTALLASGIRRMMAKASAMTDVSRLDVGEPQFATPRHIVEAAAAAARDGATKYTA
jgi:aspartate aminotransferase